MSSPPAALVMSILTAALELILLAMANTLSMRSARKDGVLSMRSVWPVGAVSSTIRSKLPFLIKPTTFANATTSSVPAGSVSNISPKSERVFARSPFGPESPPMSWSTTFLNWLNDAAGSISKAESEPSDGGTPISGMSKRDPPFKSISRASPKLCAGSVLTMATLCPAAAIVIAREELVVVLPTPPFPPQITNLDSPSSPSRCEKLGLLSNVCFPTYANAGTPTSSTSKNGTSVRAMGSELPFSLYSLDELTSSVALRISEIHRCCPFFLLS
mmetsp:Transcript_5274/g.14976  ORF Transcript_5274/g.14976 Transcript_5274/m.14976 type:complete len:273 (+) Transcript_5274:508-1326(+)